MKSKCYPCKGQICMIVGAGANITVQAGDAGALVVETGTAPMADKVLAAIRTISKKPLRYIVNTIEWPEYTGGNEKIAAAGEIIPFRKAIYIGRLVSGATSLGQPSGGDSRPVLGQHRVAISREFPCCIA